MTTHLRNLAPTLRRTDRVTDNPREVTCCYCLAQMAPVKEDK